MTLLSCNSTRSASACTIMPGAVRFWDGGVTARGLTSPRAPTLPGSVLGGNHLLRRRGALLRRAGGLTRLGSRLGVGDVLGVRRGPTPDEADSEPDSRT